MAFLSFSTKLHPVFSFTGFDRTGVIFQSVSTNKGAAKAKVLPATNTGEAASWSTSSLLTTVMAPLGATLEEIIRHNEVTHKLTQEAKICFNLQKRWRKGDETNWKRILEKECGIKIMDSTKSYIYRERETSCSLRLKQVVFWLGPNLHI